MRTTNAVKVMGMGYNLVKVECEVKPGIGIHLVGLGDIAVKESLLRTVTAMQANGYRIPGKKVVINLAPADLLKNGSGYDLAIALSVIAESGQEELPYIESLVIAGELGLDGSVRSVPGIVQIVQAAKDAGYGVIIPRMNAIEVADLFDDYEPIYVVGDLKEAIEVAKSLQGLKLSEVEDKRSDTASGWWDRIVGNAGAKRAMEIAAAGGHNMLLMGPVGSGKTAFAKAMLDILPPMSKEETMEVAKVYSAAGRLRPLKRPFRELHPGSSLASLLGGTSLALPGEVSLANRGVCYLGDYPRLPKALLEGLRGPIEDGKIVISRLGKKVEYPAHMQVVIGTEPCPCGYYGEGDACCCTAKQREEWLAKLSGPVIDHLDMQVWIHPEKPGQDVVGEPAAVVAERVAAAREMQMKRQGKLNADLERNELPELGENSEEMLGRLMDAMGLSARAFSRAIRIARTIADLAGCEEILPHHIAEAVSYRFLDRRII